MSLAGIKRLLFWSALGLRSFGQEKVALIGQWAAFLEGPGGQQLLPIVTNHQPKTGIQCFQPSLDEPGQVSRCCRGSGPGTVVCL